MFPLQLFTNYTQTHTHMYACKNASQSCVWHAQYTAQLLLCYILACTNGRGIFEENKEAFAASYFHKFTDFKQNEFDFSPSVFKSFLELCCLAVEVSVLV